MNSRVTAASLWYSKLNTQEQQKRAASPLMKGGTQVDVGVDDDDVTNTPSATSVHLLAVAIDVPEVKMKIQHFIN